MSRNKKKEEEKQQPLSIDWKRCLTMKEVAESDESCWNCSQEATACRYCGSASLTLYVDRKWVTTRGEPYVQCDKCKARGPSVFIAGGDTLAGMKTALEIWNNGKIEIASAT